MPCVITPNERSSLATHALGPISDRDGVQSFLRWRRRQLTAINVGRQPPICCMACVRAVTCCLHSSAALASFWADHWRDLLIFALVVLSGSPNLAALCWHRILIMVVYAPGGFLR